MAKTETRVPRSSPLVRYFKETRAELRKVHWPSQQEARTLTLVVLAVTVGMAALLGALDWMFDRLLSGVINENMVFIGLSVLVVVGLFVAGFFITREE